MKEIHKESGNRRDQLVPILLFVAITITMFSLIGNVYVNYVEFNSIEEERRQLLRISELQGKINYYDEVLTMSARMAASTGDLNWENRYKAFEQELDTVIKEATQYSKEFMAEGGLELTNEANDVLVSLELKAFDLVRQGRSDEALAVLFSAEYQKHKLVYSKGLKDFDAYLEQGLEKRIKEEKQRANTSFLTSSLVLLFLIIIWTSGFYIFRKWSRLLFRNSQQLQAELNERHKVEKELLKHKEELETLVDERTNELKVQLEHVKAANEELHQMKFSLDNTNNLVWWVDPKDGQILYMNLYAKERNGYALEDYPNIKVFDFDPVFNEEMWPDFAKAMREKGEMQFETQNQTIKGEVYPIAVSSKFLKYEGTEFLIAIASDISESIKAKEALKKAKDVAESANRAKSTFLANMTHEIRTPMNAVLGYSQLLQNDTNLSHEQKESLEIINRSGEHLLGLINNILDMSKIEAGKVTVLESNFSLIHLLEDIENMFKIKTQDKNLTLELIISSEVPQYIIADENKVRQVLINLVGNATKFTQEGGVTIYCTSNESKHKYISISVNDTGIGIPENKLDAVFVAFDQADDTTLKEGTGLGLAISKQFARLLKGDITVTSKAGEGSSFLFTFQYEEGSEVEAKKSGFKGRILEIADKEKESKLLLVDDRPVNLDILQKMLQPIGFILETAANGKEAVEKFKDFNPDLILMDIVMPKMDGKAASKKIRKLKNGEAVSIIALSASTLEDEREQVIKAGIDDFMRKPYREYDLLEKIAEHLDIQYIYKEDESQADRKPEEEFSEGEDLTLDAKLKTRIINAAEMGDIDELNKIVLELKEQESGFASRLERLVNSFDLSQILTTVK